MRPGVRNAVLEPPGPIDRRFNTSKNTVKNEFSRRIVALKFQNTPEPRSSRGVSISALTRRRVNLYIDGGVPSLVQSRSWTPGSLFGEVIFDAVKIFAQHFLIAGRGRRKPGGIWGRCGRTLYRIGVPGNDRRDRPVSRRDC